MADLTQFNPKDLEKRVAETIQSQFGMLIPDDVWDAKVQAEIHAFFESEVTFIWEERVKDPNSYASGKLEQLSMKISPFRQIVWKHLTELVNKRLERFKQDPNYSITSYWDDNTTHYKLSEHLDKKLEELAPKMAAKLFQDMFATSVQQAKISVMNELKQR
jgi:hypothetical protein